MRPDRYSRRLLPLALAALSLAVGLAGIVWTFPEGALTTAFRPPVRWVAPAVDAIAAPLAAVPVGAVADAVPAEPAHPEPQVSMSRQANTGGGGSHGGTTPLTVSVSPPAPGAPVEASPSPADATPQPPHYNPSAGQVAETPTPLLKAIHAQTPATASATPARSTPTPTATPRPAVATPTPATPESRPGNSVGGPGHEKAAVVVTPEAKAKKDGPRGKK